ncbi:MAG: hypothetical protein M0037_16240 [Betaproteobacteria bacterium]|nr:hypothetical protein [Betaproteobacteria bacterium]
MLAKCCLAFLLLASVAARAATDTSAARLIEANNAVEASYALSEVHYGEMRNGAYLDTENGALRGGELGLSWMGALRMPVRVHRHAGVVRGFYLHVAYRETAGGLHYDGALQTLQGQVLESLHNTSRARFKDGIFRLGQGFVPSAQVLLTPYLELGLHEWDRTLSGEWGYQETYRNAFYGLGVRVQYAAGARWILSGAVAAGRTADARITVDMARAGLGQTTMRLGPAPYYRAEIGADVALGRRLHAFAKLAYSRFEYGASSQGWLYSGTTYLAMVMVEPSSTTAIASCALGLRYTY